MGLISDYRNRRKKEKQLEMARLDSKIEKEQARAAMMKTAREVMNTGYSHGAASKSATWSKGFDASSYSAKSDIEKNRMTLRERSRELAMNAPLATAAVGTMRLGAVGSGLMPKPKIDYEFLGIGREDAEKLERKILKEFSFWAEKTFCDSADQNNFYELQQIAFNDLMRNGEAFALIKYSDKTSYMPYQLRIKLIEADRISTPGSIDGGYFGYDKRLKNGNKIMNGVEITPEGKVEAYYVSSTFPRENYDGEKQEWTRVKKRGDSTGNLNILHMFSAERAEQYRGVPFLAPVIPAIKQISRYTDAEIMAALVNSLFSVFVNTETGHDLEGYDGEEDGEGAFYEENNEGFWELGSGSVIQLKTGESVTPIESTHPSNNYDAFMTAMSTHVGAALGIAPEALLKKFSNNYSASKGALNETWRAIKAWRKWFVRDFCQEIYELWLCEAVAKERIKASGFFMDPLIRAAYSNATWNGPAQGYMNPLQEVNAAVTRIENGLSTREDECAMLNGSNFEDNVRTLTNENLKMSEAFKETKDANDSR